MNSPILYGLFSVLLVGILIWQVLSGKSFFQKKSKKPDEDFEEEPSVLEQLQGSLPDLKKPLAGIALWFFFLFTLWIFQEEVPIWNLWWVNEKFFWMSQIVILIIALSWNLGGLIKTISILLVIPFIWILLGNVEIGSLLSFQSDTPNDSLAAMVAKPKSDVEMVIAPVGSRSEEVIIDKPFDFCMYPKEDVTVYYHDFPKGSDGQRHRRDHPPVISGPGRIPNLGKLTEVTYFQFQTNGNSPVMVAVRKNCFP
ncbi:MAG: hypothetical protein AAB488_00250 [Patescibacteria group bacterium]